MSDQITLVTGASRGIGRACSDLLAQAGFSVIGLARKAPEDSFPGEFYEVDVADRDALVSFLEWLVAERPVVNLINNVGLAGPEMLEEITPETLDLVLETNLVSAILCAKYCSQTMKEQGQGRIVNISTELILGAPTRTAYGGAKAALASASRTWALELAEFGITVNTIAPGPVDTEFFRQNNPEDSRIRQEKLERIPLGRFANPSDIANMAAFLLSSEANYITGQMFHVDGGSSIASAPLF